METNIRKILLRGLITIFSILLIVIINSYLDYRLEMLPESNEVVNESEFGYDNHLIKIRTAWDGYSPTYVNLGIPEISENESNERVIESGYRSITPGKNGQ
jgi:hypothetical protein